ncbi:MAG: Rieske 2Fe-2S domain-containing protein [Methylocella sp.]|jgi:hypothetical protein
MCPHANEIWADARFNGKVLSCHHHAWKFDRTTGDCIKDKPCKLAEFPVEIKDGELGPVAQIGMAVEPPRANSIKNSIADVKEPGVVHIRWAKLRGWLISRLCYSIPYAAATLSVFRASTTVRVRRNTPRPPESA